MAVLGVLALLGYELFATYAKYLPFISNDHAAWSSFGSLLSGFFTLTGTVATVATLLFLARQNRQIQKVNEYQREVTQAQLAAMNFEQYINHRRLFMDRLVELQASFENKFVFKDGENLYNQIFTKNGPTNLVFSVDLQDTIDGENLLQRLGDRLTRLQKFLDRSQWNHMETLNLVLGLVEVYDDLQIRWTGEAFDGDIIYFRTHTGINIYSIDEIIGVATTIYNSLLFYTGNPKSNVLHKAMMRYTREALIEFFLDNHKDGEALEALKIIPGLETMERLFFNIDSLRGAKHGEHLKTSSSTLLEVFRSRADVMKLRDDVFVADFIATGCNECSLAMLSVGEDDEDYGLLKRCWDDFNSLHSRY